MGATAGEDEDGEAEDQRDALTNSSGASGAAAHAHTLTSARTRTLTYRVNTHVTEEGQQARPLMGGLWRVTHAHLPTMTLHGAWRKPHSDSSLSRLGEQSQSCLLLCAEVEAASAAMSTWLSFLFLEKRNPTHKGAQAWKMRLPLLRGPGCS